MTQTLVVLMADRPMGRIELDAKHRLRFIYDEAWREAPGAYPLSLSMPLAAPTHEHAVVNAFLWGLLPDNEFVLARWAQRFQVSPRNVFALLSHVGEDCAGAAQFIRPDRLDEVLSARGGTVEWLDEKGIAERLRDLRIDHSAWRRPRDTGQFSLPGAQPKTALLLEEGRWGIPSGRIPTTHIFKPPTGEFEGHAENELFCLLLAQELGLPAANAAIERFDDEVAIVIERYDRLRTERGWVRVHQEDMCQALGIPPMHKYENEGGPGVREIVELLREVSAAREEDVSTFLSAIAFNWLVAGTDAHAKNYALLIGAGGAARLAPLYDLASALPYERLDANELKLAMKLGGEYKLRLLGIRNWSKLAAETKRNELAVLDLVRGMASQMPGAVEIVRSGLSASDLKHPTVDTLADSLVKRANALLKGL
jgi:serine/threonine-protein kinase HipA